MALSNWDTLALNQDGPSDGILTSPMGVSVAIYKNWLYVLDPHNAREGGRFDPSSDTVMQVDAGSLAYLDVQIEAVRGPQEGIYTVVLRGEQVMVGCGVYGWEPTGAPQMITNFDTYLPPPWLGVTPESVHFLRAFAAEHLGGEHPLMSGERWADVVRFNQGDAFLAEALELASPATAVGAQQDPVATAIFGSREAP